MSAIQYRGRRIDGEKLRALRERQGLKREDLASSTGISYSLLVKLEQGLHDNPGIEYASALADALDCRIEDMLTERLSSDGEEGKKKR